MQGQGQKERMKGDEVEELSSAMVQQSKQLDHSQLFLTNIARKCTLFFQPPSNITIHDLAQHLWKAKRIPQACAIHPELTIEEIEVLVDRDWRMMGEQERSSAIVWDEMLQEVERQCNEMQREIEQCFQTANE